MLQKKDGTWMRKIQAQ